MPPIAQDPIRRVSFTVANGATASTKADLMGHVPVGVITPAALTSTTLAFDQWDDVVGDWVPVYDDTGTEVSITIAASRYTVIPPSTVPYVGKTRLRVGSAEAAERTLVLVTRALG